MVDLWSMVNVLSMVQDEDGKMWRLNASFFCRWSMVHGPSNGAWSTQSMVNVLFMVQDEDGTMEAERE